MRSAGFHFSGGGAILSQRGLCKTSDVEASMSDLQTAIGGMDNGDLLNYFDNAATKALYSGDGDAAWVMKNFVNGPRAYGDVLKSNAVVLLKDKPGYLKYFSSDFTNRIR